MNIRVAFLFFSMILSLSSYAQRSFLNSFKQDFLYRCTGIFSSTNDSAGFVYPTLGQEKCDLRPGLHKENPYLQKLTKLSQDYGVDLEFVGKSRLDLESYALNSFLFEKGGTKIHPSKVSGDIDDIFPFAVFDEDMEISLSGESQKIDLLKKELNDFFTALGLRPKFYENVGISKLNSAVYDSVDTASKTISLPENLKELSRQEQALSVFKSLSLSSRYQLHISEADIHLMKETIGQLSELDENSQKAALAEMIQFFQRSSDIERAVSLLKRVDPEKKLLKILGEDYEKWAGRKYLSSEELGKGAGRTARSLGIEHVTHQTSRQNYYTIISNPQGRPNLRVSRTDSGGLGELARRGEGFYAMKGIDSEFHPDYGNYKVVLKVHPDARLGRDFTLYNNEVLFHNLSALEIDLSLLEKDFDPLDFFTRMSFNSSDSSLYSQTEKIRSLKSDDLYRQEVSTLSKLLLDPTKRAEIDQLALEIFESRSIHDVADIFVEKYLSLPFEGTRLQQQAEEAFLDLMSESLFDSGRSQSLSLFKLWLNHGRFNEHRDLVKKFIDNPVWNGEVLVNDSVFAFLNTKVTDEEWFLMYLKKSEVYPHFIKSLEGLYPSQEVVSLLKKLKSFDPSSNCRDLMSKFF